MNNTNKTNENTNMNNDNINNKFALWVSDKLPTNEDLDSIKDAGYNLIIIMSRPIDNDTFGLTKFKTEDDIEKCWENIIKHIKTYNAVAIFGNALPPLQNKMFMTEHQSCSTKIPFYSAWKYQTLTKNKEIKFEFKKWVLVGNVCF